MARAVFSDVFGVRVRPLPEAMGMTTRMGSARTDASAAVRFADVSSLLRHPEITDQIDIVVQRLLSALLPPIITAITTPTRVTNDMTRAMAATRG